jgi:hypothetical protein
MLDLTNFAHCYLTTLKQTPKILVTPLHGEMTHLVDPRINFCCLSSSSQVQQWTLQIKKLLVLCQKRLVTQLDIYLQLLLFLTDINNVQVTIPNFNKM